MAETMRIIITKEKKKDCTEIVLLLQMKMMILKRMVMVMVKVTIMVMPTMTAIDLYIKVKFSCQNNI